MVENLTIEEMAIVGWILAITFGALTTYFAWRSNDLSKIRIAPHLNIILSDTFIKSEDKKILHIHINVENSGEGVANFPKCYWKLVSQNGYTINSGGWLNFPLFGGKSYIESHSNTINGYYTYQLSNKEKGELFNTAYIWLRCTDVRNKMWCSYAHFGPDEKGRLITIVESKVWMVRKRQNTKKLSSMFEI